jgi:hypothetical protein
MKENAFSKISLLIAGNIFHWKYETKPFRREYHCIQHSQASPPTHTDAHNFVSRKKANACPKDNLITSTFFTYSHTYSCTNCTFLSTSPQKEIVLIFLNVGVDLLLHSVNRCFCDIFFKRCTVCFRTCPIESLFICILLFLLSISSQYGT